MTLRPLPFTPFFFYHLWPYEHLAPELPNCPYALPQPFHTPLREKKVVMSSPLQAFYPMHVQHKKWGAIVRA